MATKQIEPEQSKKSQPSNPLHPTVAAILDPSAPLDRRKMLLLDLITSDEPLGDLLVGSILNAAASAKAESLHQAKLSEFQEFLTTLREGPLREGVYIGPSGSSGSHLMRRHCVKLENGESVHPVLSAEDMGLRRGECVLMDAKCQIILSRDVSVPQTGEIAELESRIDADRIEITTQQHTRDLLMASEQLARELDAGNVQPGTKLVAWPRARMAFAALPQPQGSSRYRYLVTNPLPDVDRQRDVGAPHPFIQQLVDHVDIHVRHPELAQAYKRRPMQTMLLYGIPGSGKTFHILAAITALYQWMSELTQLPVDELPSRVLQLRSPEVLSQWLGASDKNMDRFFDECSMLADEVFTARDGRKWQLPVIARCEEIDSMARARGSGQDVYDRIQTTLLDRLDHLPARMGERLIIFLFSTNVIEHLDTAFLRRGAGGKAIRFGNLDRRQFAAVLGKHVASLPLSLTAAGRNGTPPAEAERQVVRRVTDWLFSRNGHDAGQLQITYVGAGTPAVKYRRDLLTPAIVDRSVQQAADEALRLHHGSGIETGITPQLLIAAFDEQLRSVCDQIHAHNVQNYTTLPEGVRVGAVHRIAAPAVQSHEMDESMS